jgi:hypothetical protein
VGGRFAPAGDRNETGRRAEAEGGHVHIQGLATAGAEHVGLMEHTDIAVAAYPPVEGAPGRKVDQALISGIAIEMLEGPPILDDHDRPAAEILPGREQTKLGSPAKLGQHPGHGGRHGQPLPRLVPPVDPHADEKNHRAFGPARAALGRLAATGRGYVRFAVSEPGLFRVAFTPCPNVAPVAGERLGPYEMLCAALDDCVAAGVLPPERRQGADRLAWIGVHGLAMLTIDGPFPSAGPSFDRLLEATLEFIADGLGCLRIARRK